MQYQAVAVGLTTCRLPLYNKPMFVITVIPIKKGITKDTLSYISAKKFSEGSIIDIPIRKETERGLVLSCEKAENQKAEIKDLSFQLRKLEDVTEKKLLRPSFVAALKELSGHYAVSLGALLAQSTRDEIFAEENFLSEQKEIEPHVFESYAIQNRDKDRFEIYRSLIRESFAKRQSVFFVAPTEERARRANEMLKKGIEDYCLLELFKSKKKLRENLKTLTESTHPLVLIGTIDLLPLIPTDTAAIIVDEEHSRFWRKRTRPFLDGRSLLLAYAKKTKIKIFFGSLMLRVETHAKIADGEIAEYGYMLGKIHHPVKTLVVDLKKTHEANPADSSSAKFFDSKNLALDKKTFKVLSDELKEMVSYASNKKKKMFVFGARRGLSPQTLCLDCGNVVLCTKCEAPVVLHKKILEDKTVFSFICHHCGLKRDAFEKCATCGSWRLEAFGIGTQRITDEIEKITGISPLILDSDSAKTASQARKIAENFLKKGGVLVGTEMAFDYLEEESVEYSTIASFDSLFSIPDFRANEHIMRIILETKLLASENMLVQGRNVTDPVIETGLQGDISKCIREELSARKNFSYPPYRTFIKISIKNARDAVKKDVEILSNLLSKWSPTVFPAFIKTERGKTIANLLLSLPTSRWPDEQLRNILMSFPPYIEVKVDPESLL